MTILIGRLRPTSPSAQRALYANAAAFIASAVTTWAAIQEHSVYLSVLGAVFLVWSTISLFQSGQPASSRVYAFFAKHSRSLNIAAFSAAVALAWYAIDARLVLPSVMGSLLLMATAYKLFGKQAA